MRPVSWFTAGLAGRLAHYPHSSMPWVAVESSAATAVRYSVTRHWLDVEYTNGGQYRYFRVPPEVYRELMAAESIGTYLNQCIKPDYRYVRLSLVRL